jgi:hypothetical protein
MKEGRKERRKGKEGEGRKKEGEGRKKEGRKKEERMDEGRKEGRKGKEGRRKEGRLSHPHSRKWPKPPFYREVCSRENPHRNGQEQS